MFTLDTNCLIYYFKGEEKVIDLIQNLILERTPIFISIITKVEVLAYPEITPGEVKTFLEMMKNMILIEFDDKLTNLVVNIRRKHKIKLPDAIIAATSLYTNSTLITRNIKDFSKIKELNIFPI
jgi:predicted nucleic acid-binding protein